MSNTDEMSPEVSRSRVANNFQQLHTAALQAVVIRLDLSSRLPACSAAQSDTHQTVITRDACSPGALANELEAEQQYQPADALQPIRQAFNQ
jgi:hypothetical protein